MWHDEGCHILFTLASLVPLEEVVHLLTQSLGIAFIETVRLSCRSDHRFCIHNHSILLILWRMNSRSRNSTTVPNARDISALFVKPATRKVKNDTEAAVNA